MDLSKAFDTLNYNLLLAQLKAYGFCFDAIKFAESYLSKRFQRVNINNNFKENTTGSATMVNSRLPFIQHFNKCLFYTTRSYLQFCWC